MNTQRKNTLCSLILHLTAIVCGLILPRETLAHYGSSMNGMVQAVAQFLSYTVLMELGIGAVIPAALYQPLAVRDWDRVSAILSSGSRVFRRIAGFCLVYVLLLLALFPALSGIAASAWFVLILGGGTIVRYLIGMPEKLLVISDQKGYVVYSLATVCTVLSTALQVFLIRAGSPLTLVRLAGTGLTTVQLLCVFLYARRTYPIRPSVRYTGEPIARKWDGVAQHVAYFVLENTDVVLLTLFMTFGEVSVYSVYFMVISGVRRIFASVTASVQPKLGALLAQGDEEQLKSFFASFERRTHLAAAAVFGCLGLFLAPFVQVYTEGITDADYFRPVFAALMTAAYGFQSIRDVYDKLILAAGHFRQTRNQAVAAAAMNLGISLIAVRFLGLEGVAAGTLAAMAYQTVWMSLYDSRSILRRPARVLIRTALTDAAIVLLILAAARLIRLPAAALVRQVLEPVRSLF